MFVIIHGGLIHSTIHVSDTLQGMRNLRKPVGSVLYIHSGGRLSSHVKAIWTCSLELPSGYVMQLEKYILRT